MPDFVRRFGTPDGNGGFVLSSSRQSIITSLLSAGCVLLLLAICTFLNSFSCSQNFRVRPVVNLFFNAPLPQLVNFRGALGQALTSDRYGRKGSILVWSLIFTIGVAIQTATTFSIVQITIGRFIAGLGVGALSGSHIISNCA